MVAFYWSVNRVELQSELLVGGPLQRILNIKRFKEIVKLEIEQLLARVCNDVAYVVAVTTTSR